MKFFLHYVALASLSHLVEADKYASVLLQCTGLENNECFVADDSRGAVLTNYGEILVANAASGVHSPGDFHRRLLEQDSKRGLRGNQVVDATEEHDIVTLLNQSAHRGLGKSRCKNLYLCIFFGWKRRELASSKEFLETRKSFGPEGSHDNRGLTSASSFTSLYSVNLDKACQGEKDFYSVVASNTADCESACSADKNCQAYQFRKDTFISTCQLWTTLPTGFKHESGVQCNIKAFTTENHALSDLLVGYPLTTDQSACLSSTITCDITWIHSAGGLANESPVCEHEMIQLGGGSLMNFEQAKALAPQGCHLAPVRSTDAFFADVQAAMSGSECWVGIKKDVSTGETAGTNGWYNIYDNIAVPDNKDLWKWGEPNNSHGSQTVATVNRSNSKKLRDVQEGDRFSCGIYECCMDADASELDSELTRYIKIEGQVNFPTARANAPTGCVLAPIRTVDELDLVAGSVDYGECLVGIYKNISAGAAASTAGWTNIMDNSPVPDHLSLWKSGEPNNSHGAQKVATVNRGGSFKLRDVQETDTFGCAVYLCDN